ncbi:hypothetical protein L2755_07590 [Shewanella abyssi]|uniref:hypothetical protein n=1 Tax=Shewanella abyssi TaxID=311789 RepID=UPI00200CA9A8|nr:hypothetical protein [Shewanella abyssi]MCL1049480.1 hypothetical protein [Shewanella abyssi]
MNLSKACKHVDVSTASYPGTLNSARRSSSDAHAENDTCAVNTSAINAECFFDYTTTIEIVPESTRDSVFLSGDLELTDDLRLFADASVSNFKMTTRIAPYPTGYFNLPSAGSPLVEQYVVPYLTDAERAAYDSGDLSVQAR